MTNIDCTTNARDNDIQSELNDTSVAAADSGSQKAVAAAIVGCTDGSNVAVQTAIEDIEETMFAIG